MIKVNKCIISCVRLFSRTPVLVFEKLARSYIGCVSHWLYSFILQDGPFIYLALLVYNIGRVFIQHWLCPFILQDGPFVWEKDLQGHILGAFFYGYLVSQIPGVCWQRDTAVNGSLSFSSAFPQ